MADHLNRRVLLTGATGLLGTHVVAAWPDSGPTLVAVGSADGDLLDAGGARAVIERHDPTDVVHLAWCASGTPGYRVSELNERWLAASLGLVELAHGVGARCWLTGTVVDVLGEADDADPYAGSKAALRRALAPAIDRGEVGWLRPTYVFDESRARPAVVAAALAALREGRPVELSSADEQHDFIHAADVGAAVALAVIEDVRGLLDIGSGSNHRVAALVEALGASWTRAPSAPPTVRHSVAHADVAWLTGRGWAPVRTATFFGDDDATGRSPREGANPVTPDQSTTSR